MNIDIKLQLLNAHALCVSHINNGLVKSENFIENGMIQDLLKVYHNQLNDSIKRDYNFEKFKIDLLKRFEVKKPTQAAAEAADLETWLDSSKRSNPEKRYNAYRQVLIDEKKGDMIQQLDADTYKILDSCHNPNELKRAWDRRGLVYGNVQSGKTANYIGLINRAFDAGYQIVIVLTGMTEDLRVQTQRRIDSGVVGKYGEKVIGIGKKPGFKKLPQIRPATTLNDDLSRANKDVIASLIDTKEKSIWVIKKNKAVLENLILWLDKQRSNGKDSKIHNVPFLVIDDEADNASIQSMTKKDYESWGQGQNLANIEEEELTPEQQKNLQKAKESVIRAINRNIRVALSLMSHKTFVAYTATPYSIINQSIEDIERTVKIQEKTFIIDKDSDLFPEHFIIPIKAGDKYIGIDRVFTSHKDSKLPVVINISKQYPNENLDFDYFPSKRGTPYMFLDIPNSLEDSILHFLINIVIRKFRDKKVDDYNSLLVHTSHLTDNADYVAIKIDQFIEKLMQNLPGNNGGYYERIKEIFKNIKANSSNRLFKEYFDEEYDFPASISRDDILNILYSKKDASGNYIYAPLEIVSYHSSNQKHLKHKNHILKFDLRDEDGNKKFKNYIVVGGNRLSRGLTLEGLSISYFVRNSTRQDSLYQMARWFGYRIGYEDLVRIFMPKHQITWFEAVYKLEVDLRKDFESNNSEDTKMLPRDAVIKLACHTDDHQHIPVELRKKFPYVCDPNKLRNTRKRKMSFYGTTSVNRIIRDNEIQKNNLNVLKNTFESVKNDSTAKLFNANNNIPKELKNNNVNYTDVDFKHIINLLNNYEAHNRLKDDIASLIQYVRKNKEKLNKWSLVLVNRGINKFSYMEGEFYNENGDIVTQTIKNVKRKSQKIDKQTLYFPSILDRQDDNVFDLIDKDFIKDYQNEKISQAATAKKYRNKSGKPILLTYLAYTEGVNEIELFPLIYCFIPTFNGAESITYIVRK